MQFFTGCYNRAYHFSNKITEIVRKQWIVSGSNPTFDFPFKHFMFGSFERTFDGQAITWAYHVAPIIKLNDGELYILDPVLSDKPMKKDAYHSEMAGGSSKLNGYVTCQPDTYDEKDDCFDSQNNPPRNIEELTRTWLLL